MARILYGVMGNTHGHVMRTLSVVSRMRERHEFLFAGGGRVPAAMRAAGFEVLELPVLRTVHRDQKVDVPATIGQIAKRVVESPDVCRSIRDAIESFQPDLAVCDREFFLPLACRQAGLRCISLDHSHVLKACEYTVPRSQWVSWSLAMVNDYLFFDFIRESMVVSFFHPPLRPGRTDMLLPPVLRPEAAARVGEPGSHVLLYQTSNTFPQLVEALRGYHREVRIYGFAKEERREGNLLFRAYDPVRILDDLAGCAYAVVNGGHNLICEALHFGKPVLCFPIAMLFEQFLNARHVRLLGYGDFLQTRQPERHHFEAFEKGLERYTENLAGKTFDGTGVVVAELENRLAGA